MKRFLFRFTVLIMVVLLSFSAAACSPKDKGSLLPDSDLPLSVQSFSNVEVNTVDGDKHKIITKTNSKIMINGQTEYSLVLPANATSFEILAAEEFNLFFAEATGKELSVIYDTQIVEGGKYISIGDTALSTNANIEYDAQLLGEAGYQIKTVGNNIYLSAPDDYGILYSVYELLHQMLGFEQYYKDFYSLDKGVLELPLMNYDVVDYPDIEYRAMLHASMNGSVDERRMRLRTKDEMFVKQFGASVSNHNAFKYIPKETYLNDPTSEKYRLDWYSEDKTQLCYLAHGDEQLFNELIKTVGDQVIEQLDRSEENIIHLGHTDATTWCTCSACRAYLGIYKANSSTVLNFCNHLYDYVENHYQGLGQDKEFQITFFAYYGTNPAPAQYNEQTGKYEPINGLVCRDGVCVYWADTNINYQQSIYGEDNVSYYQSLLGWQAVSEKMYVWSYNTNFNDFFVPFDSFNTMQDFYGLMKDLGVYYLYDQGQVQFGGSTGWTSLKYYLVSKYGWDVDCNQEELTKNFFANVYGPASGIMLNLFNQLRTHFTIIENVPTSKGGYYGGNNAVFQKMVDEEFWPERTLRSWLNGLQSALDEIEILKVDVKTYEKLYRQIILERISYNYLLISLYESDNKALKSQTKTDMEYIGMSRTREGANIDTLFNQWGV